MSPVEAMEMLRTRMVKTNSNAEFLNDDEFRVTQFQVNYLARGAYSVEYEHVT